MRNFTLFAFLVLPAACVTRTADPRLAPRSWYDAPAEVAPASEPSASGTPTANAVAPALLGKDGYTKFSLGVFDPAGDIKGLDQGYYAQVAFGGDLIPLVSIEASLGYAHAEGSGNSDLTLVPLFVNGRIQVPIAVIKAYGGVGIGGAFLDYKFGSVSDDQFLLAGTAFLGAEFGLGNLAVGVEYRYITTEETDRNFTPEGHCGLITLTLPF